MPSADRTARQMERTISKAVRWLDHHPEGADPADVAAGLELTEGHLRRALQIARERGLIFGQASPTRDSKTRVLYYAIKHCHAGRDHRHTVTTPEPYYSVGADRSSCTDTWATRYLASRATK